MGWIVEALLNSITSFLFVFCLPPQLRLNKDELIMKCNQLGYMTYSIQLYSRAPGASAAEKIDIKSVFPMILLC